MWLLSTAGRVPQLCGSFHSPQNLVQSVKVLTYQEGVEAFRVTDRLSDSDKAALMGESLTRVYNWAPSQA